MINSLDLKKAKSLLSNPANRVRNTATVTDGNLVGMREQLEEIIKLAQMHISEIRHEQVRRMQ
jgi:hypothetical protein